jgi:hypothetical protein
MMDADRLVASFGNPRTEGVIQAASCSAKGWISVTVRSRRMRVWLGWGSCLAGRAGLGTDGTQIGVEGVRDQ